MLPSVELRPGITIRPHALFSSCLHTAIPQGPGRGGFGNDNWPAQGNRFGVLQQQQLQGGGGGGQQPRQETPEEAVRNDLQAEKPTWLLSCYGHARGGANDLTGDVSFEEARWSTLQDIHAQRTPLTINAEFKGAVRAKQEELNQLLARTRERGGRVPSLGGPPIRVHNAWLAQFLEQQPAVGHAQPGRNGAAPQSPPAGFGFGSPQHTAPASGSFGAAPSSFGQLAGFGHPAAPAPVLGPFGQPTGFGAPPQAAPGSFSQQPVAVAAPFGQPSGGGFGGGSGTGFGPVPAGGGAKASWTGQGGFGAAKSAAGQAPAVLFGQNLAAGASTGRGGAFVPMVPAGQAAQMPLGAPAFSSHGFPPAVPLQGFGSPTPVDLGSGAAPALLGQVGIFQAPVAATAAALTGAATVGDGGADVSAVANGNSAHEDLHAFQAIAFTLGKIPEMAPPLELCF
ncbi:hypothetical protein Vretimale_18929 [Volvox reticuliferus]|uniref:Uncharacterized protein n=1 Tax=Volvox reticuliferus TaxID=1737510 RepID=A0A8J4GYY1_9CHLO|nr:hypothetical protein Vretimale_18929 [Volvox reticuliferus]